MRPKPTSEERIVELDGLRGLAILLVLIYHYFVIFANWPSGSMAARITSLGRLTWSGVDLFFVLSGFLIGGILLDQRKSGRYYSTFYVRRFYRIVPLYLVVIAAFIVFQRLFSYDQQPGLFWLLGSAPHLAVYLTYTQNFWTALTGNFGPNWLSPTWSLAIEEQFYLMLPVFVRYVPSRVFFHVLLLVIVLAPILRTLLVLNGGTGLIAAHVLMPCRADSLLFGVVAAYVVRTERGWNWLLLHRRALFSAMGVLLAGAAVFTVKGYTVLTPQMSTFGYTWLALLYLSLLLIAVAHRQTLIGRLLRLGPLRQLGEIAYGVYLLHGILQGLYFWLLLGTRPHMASISDLSVALAALMLSVMLAWVSWKYFELRLLRRGRSFQYQEQPAP
jgi:peptidoglycan/LPS O-acetylase OafA/YrhL